MARSARRLARAYRGRFTLKEARFNAQALAQEFGTFDCLVSPANAFGIMDGGYDLALTRALIVDGDAWALTNPMQDVLRKRHRAEGAVDRARERKWWNRIR
ncbi:hypothetical protein OH77DRAFT_1423771 [Trametes cingulata]|nr:hypothetical protein OH77DRAFT_1423771 [Trametes cingulata]